MLFVRMESRHVQLRRNHSSLRRLGVAAQRFPFYRRPIRACDFIHDTLYISVLLAGRVVHHVGGAAVEEFAGTATVVSAGTGHEIITGRRTVDVFNLYLDPQRHALPRLPAELAPHLARLLPLHAGLVSNLNRLVRVVLPDPARTAGWLTAIEAEQENEAPGSDAVLRSLLELVLIDLARAASAAAPVSRLAEDPPLERAAAVIEERFADDLRVVDLAAAASMSPWHFTRRFTAWAGRSPMRCLRDRRLQEAMSRLRTDDDRVLDIALACGFRDLAHFNRTFKAVAGRTPSAYRKALG